MRWRDALQHFYSHLSPADQQIIAAQIATDNDLAESYGFTCLFDHHTGGGQCYFEHQQDKIHVYQSPRGGYSRVSTVPFASANEYTLFHTLIDALENKNPRGYLDKLGRFTTAAAAAAA